MKNLRLFKVMFLFLTSMSIASPVERLPSIDWQKQTLEEKTRVKIDSILKSVLKKNQYNIDIEILTTDTEPDFTSPEDSENKNEEVKNEENKEELEKKEKDKKETESQAKVKFVDDYPDNPEDFIIFNKFGIEAPLVDDFNDFRPDGKIILAMPDKTKEQNYKTKLDEYQRKISELKNDKKSKDPVEQMWKYNSAIDIFKNLKAVNILVRVSNSLPDEVKTAVEKYIRNLKFNFGRVKPNIKIEYVLLGKEASAPTSMDKLLEVFNYLAKFSTFLGLVFAVLLFGIIGRSLINKFFEMNTGKTQSGDFRIQPQEDDEKNDEQDVGTEGSGDNTYDGSFSGSLSGVDRFITLFNHDARGSVLLIKKWIQEDDSKGKKSLKALVQLLNNEQLEKIFSFLSEQERSSWQSLLALPLTNTELAIANDYIGNQIVQSIIVDKYIDDPETFDLVLKLKINDVAQIIENNVEIGAILLNVLNTKIVNNVLPLCSDDIQMAVVKKATTLSTSEIRGAQAELKSVLSDFVDRTEMKPFVTKLIDLIADAHVSIENSLYEGLVQNADIDTVKEIMLKYLPADIIPQMPKKFLKETLTTYDLKLKVEMLWCINDEVRDFFMEIFAPEGSKAAELISLEFEFIEMNKKRIEKLEERSEEVWQLFVDYVRARVRKDKELQQQLNPLLNDWIEDFRNKTGSHELNLAS